MKSIAVLIALAAAAAADFSIEVDKFTMHVKGDIPSALLELIKAYQNVLTHSGSKPTSAVQQNKTFHAFPTKVNWHQAMMICNSHNMRLASINSETEQAMLVKHLKSSGLATEDVYFWLSGADLAGDGFVWMGTGQPMTYKKWYKSEPNNYGGNEHCVETRGIKTNFEWNDETCSQQRFFVCEDIQNNC